jgi:SAM-dependent methyltransferase
MARDFLDWLDTPSKMRWLDVGCGTGALSEAILRQCDPASVEGCDPTEAMLPFTREHITDHRASFRVGDAQDLPFENDSFDVLVSGLVLNFIPDIARGLAEMVRVTRHGGTVAAYVWDYAGRMQLIRSFWDAAVALDRGAQTLDEGTRFPICQPSALEQAFRNVRLSDVRVEGIEIPTVFRDFEDLWLPFLGSAGPAANYTTSLRPEDQTALRERVRADLPIAADGSISLVARAWAVHGRAS